MSTAIPQIPPRPQRAQDQIPKIPPRPARKIERSVSPHRESYARSPLNDTPFFTHQRSTSKSSLTVSGAADLPPRPPSVVLPSIGQEGSEYAEIFTPDPGATHVANNLELHAPKPSHPSTTAKQRLSTVTRTDSDQAASFGIGKARTDKPVIDDVNPDSRTLKKKESFASQNSAKERRPSSVGSEHGIPEIGQRVPMLKHAGDVQAPSPAPYATPYAPGIGFHNDGSKPRHHARRTSARGDLPQDAYGRFGHNIPLQSDKFEKAYYEKHPELLKKELGHYGDGRPEWALSSDDLNRIVRDTASRGAGLGTSPAVLGTPTEEIGFQASEEYASRISSPRPQSGYGLAHGNNSATHVDSPLRKESFPADGGAKADIEKAVSKGLAGAPESVVESEADDDDVIHVDHPGYRLNKIYSRNSNYESADDSRRHSGVDIDKLHEDHGYSAPILAEDEVAKGPYGYELQPAVSPNHERRPSYFDEHGHYHTRSGSDSMSNSRPTSRPASIHGVIPGVRIQDHTQLEDLQEYEPLFPEEDQKGAAQKPQSHADRLKQRPDLKSKKFPSQDIWEDTPNSLQYTATVSTPQSADDFEEEKPLVKPEVERTETPGQAFARRQEELAEKESHNSDSFLHREQKKKHWKPDVQSDLRPSAKQRFPSRDIWEDTPDSLQLQTTVGGPQSEEAIVSPPDERPTTGAVVYHHEKLAAGVPLDNDEGRATTGIAATLLPQVPARPNRTQRSESPEKSQPVVPDRPTRTKGPTDSAAAPPVPVKTKPVVPARPIKPVARQDSSEGAPLTTVASNSSTKSVGSDQGVAVSSKPKPPVPSRPVGSKIAALQGGFMSDLNKRLQLGPQAPKKEEAAVEEPEIVQEKAPLADARKGRARGPTRRAPAKSPSPSSAFDKPALALGFTITATLWEIDPEEDDVQVGLTEQATPPPSTEKPTEHTRTLVTNTAGESIGRVPDLSSPATDAAPSLSSPRQDLKAEKMEKAEKADLAAEFSNEDLAPAKPSDEPSVVSKSSFEPEIEPEPKAESTPAAKHEEIKSDTVPGSFDEEDEMAASTATIKPSDVEKQ